MKELKLKPCPFCGAELDANDGLTVSKLPTGSWLVSHYCGIFSDLSVCIDAYGGTREEAIDKWNQRRRKQKNEPRGL